MSYKICSKCGIRKSRVEFHKNVSRKDGIQSWCKECSIKGRVDYYKRNKQKEADYDAKRRKRNRRFIRTYLRFHPCVDCGERDIVVLDFDHVRGKKVDNVTTMVGSHGLPRIKAEIRKCEIRCANCHRRKTYAELVQR